MINHVHLDIAGPIEPLRDEMIRLAYLAAGKHPYFSPKRVYYLHRVIPRLRKDDRYVRHQANNFMQLAIAKGVAEKVRQ